MRYVTFPADQAVGWLDWLGAERGRPILARGEVAVPDGVEVSLDVRLIESVRLDDCGPVRSRLVTTWIDGRGNRWSTEEVSRPGWTLVGSGQPADLGFLRVLPGDVITKLGLSSPIVAESFAAVEHLAPGLRSLCLASTGLTDAALVSVARLRGLTFLQTWGNQFTDDGVQQLAALSGLVSLHLEESTLSAAAFAFASALPRLRELGLQDVPATVGELADLRARLPGVRVG